MAISITQKKDLVRTQDPIFLTLDSAQELKRIALGDLSAKEQSHYPFFGSWNP